MIMFSIQIAFLLMIKACVIPKSRISILTKFELSNLLLDIYYKMYQYTLIVCSYVMNNGFTT